jgi:hypothetical protein
MAMILEAHKVCPHVNTCPYKGGSVTSEMCYGARSDRNVEFTCDYVVNGQVIVNAGIRLPQDKTGKMKVIME